MRYLALATDYDGTLASHGTVAPETVAALRELATSGRKLILVTGRRIDDLTQVFPEVAIFDRVVAENGPLVYRPQSQETRTLSKPPPAAFVEELERVAHEAQPRDARDVHVVRNLFHCGLRLEDDVVLRAFRVHAVHEVCSGERARIHRDPFGRRDRRAGRSA